MGNFVSLDRLISCLGRLPGVGRRSAERMAVRLVRDPAGFLDDLIRALQAVQKDICCCSRCGSVTTVDREPCALCTAPNRDGHLLCVVEDPGDVMLLEKSGRFSGRYHALMGKLSPMKGAGPRDLRIKALLTRVQQEEIREVILALSTDMEGDSTASFLAEFLKEHGVKVSRLAFGLPAGSGILYSDPITLGRALDGRTDA